MALKLNNYSWWKFFDKAGDLANFTYDEESDKWSGIIYIDKVSTDLIEYEPLYVLEDWWDASAGLPGVHLGLNAPRKLNMTGPCPGATENNILLKWKDNEAGYTGENVPEIFLWTMDGYPGPDPTLIRHDELDIDLTQTSGGNFLGDLPGGGGVGGTGQGVLSAVSAQLKSEALSIRVGLQGATEGSYTRTLQFIDPNYLPSGTTAGSVGCTATEHVFAEVTFYGETEEEDVRLDTMLENLGDRITNQDFNIFDDTDINEALPDFIKLNQKRKELLLEWSNIFPFTGSYKALINVLKYFGYDQVTLKEYWLNVKEAKGINLEGVPRIRYKQTPIEDLFSDEPKTANIDHSLYPSKLYKKTSKFGLFYDITRDSGQFDDDGIPIVEEAFLFTNEEVLVKLFALKQKLKNYFLPLNARIVDIIGEAVYYARYDVNVWNDVLRTDDVELNINPCVEIAPNAGCNLITDLTAENFLGVKIPPDLNMAGVSEYVVYAVGVTQSGSAGSLDLSGIDTYRISDSHSGLSFDYTTPYYVGITSITQGIIDTWESQTIEPWTNFTLTTELDQDPTTVPEILPGYSWFYAVQKEPIGPTSGQPFIIGVTAFAGATTSLYTTPGVTATIDLAPTLGVSALSNYATAFLGYFDGYNIDADKLNDYPCAPIGAPFVLTNCSFELDWNEGVVNWNSIDFKSSGLGITGSSAWSNYSYFNYTYTHGPSNDSYPLGGTNPYGGTGATLPSGPPGGTSFGGATPGSPLPGQTYSSVAFTYPTGPSGTFGYGPTFAFGTPTSPTANPTLWDWENIGTATFTELEWIITFEDTPTPTGATSWVLESGLMSLEQGENYPIVLPYVGTYKVELRLYDAFGGVSTWITNSALCVDTKDIDFIGHYRFRECDYTWDKKTINRQSDEVPAPYKPTYPEWEMYNSTWQLPIQENEEMSMQDLTYNDLDRIEFYQTQNDPQFQGDCNVMTPPAIPGLTGSSGLTDLDSYKWNLIQQNASWADVCHLWWDITNPKISQIRVEHPTTLGTTPTLLMFKEPFVGKPDHVMLTGSTAFSGTTAIYGTIAYDISIGATGVSNVYQYLGNGLAGSTGFGPTAWVESDIEMDHFTFADITDGGAITGNDQWREFVRQFNIELQNHGASHSIMDNFLLYYQESYDDPLNPLTPYLQWVSKEQDNTNRHYLRLYDPAIAYNPIPLTLGSGSTAFYASSYNTVNFGDMGDIPRYIEIFAVGASGGSLWVPGPTTYVDPFGVIQPGVTHWEYPVGATTLPDLWQQLTYMSQGKAPTGPSAGITDIYMSGPLVDMEWNIVYGASGYTGPTGSTMFPPPAGLTAVKIQGYPNYFDSYDYQCVYFTGPTPGQEWFGATGATNHVLGGTGGLAGTMCGRSITSNSTWNTLRIHQYAKEFPLLTQIQFNYSLSPMNGKIKPRWTLIKENDENWENIYYNNPYFSYLFTQTGSYTLELRLEDNNGNTRTKTKKEFVKII